MIRPATHDDITAILQLSAAMHNESRYRTLPYNADKFAAVLQQLLDSPQGMVAVAQREGRVIGAIAAVITEHYFADATISYELGLYIEKPQRGGLAGYRLAKAYIDWARSRGVDQIDMGITTGINESRTASLYTRLGLNRVGTVFSGGQ